MPPVKHSQVLWAQRNYEWTREVSDPHSTGSVGMHLSHTWKWVFLGGDVQGGGPWGAMGKDSAKGHLLCPVSYFEHFPGKAWDLIEALITWAEVTLSFHPWLVCMGTRGGRKQNDGSCHLGTRERARTSDSLATGVTTNRVLFLLTEGAWF